MFKHSFKVYDASKKHLPKHSQNTVSGAVPSTADGGLRLQFSQQPGAFFVLVKKELLLKYCLVVVDDCRSRDVSAFTQVYGASPSTDD